MRVTPEARDSRPEGERSADGALQAAEAHLERGNALMGAMQLQAALAAYDAALAAFPEAEGAYVNRGVALRRLGRPAEAVASYEAALRLNPDHPAALYNRANALVELGRLEEAVAGFDAALRLSPDSPEVLNSRGHALLGLGRTAAALEDFEAALARRPAFGAALQNQGAALMELARPEAALASFEAALALDPNHADALTGRGGALLQLGRAEAAIASCDRAIALNPADASAHMNRALAHLTLGRFAEGWREYEHRWNVRSHRDLSAGEATPELAARFDPALTLADLEGRRVLLVAEQGVGDVLMFASIVPDVTRIAGAVTLLCERRLQRLFAASFPSVAVLDPRAADFRLPEADCVAPLGSLGRLFRNQPSDFPGRPYLSPRANVRARWEARLGPKEGRLRVGLSWRGGAVRTYRAARSIALDELRPLLALPDMEFVSLQYGDAGGELEALNAGLARPVRVFPPADIEDFEELAGLVQALDVVVSVQTAAVHLAGGLGAPALVMVPRVPEWRYAAGGTTMPWYGSVLLYRQGEDGAWPPVVSRIRERLCAMRECG